MIKLLMLRNALLDFCKREHGASAIEYGIIAGLIAVVIIGGAAAIGTDLDGIFDAIATKLTVPA